MSESDLKQEMLAMIKSMHREIKAWRGGINHRNMNKAKVGATYVPEWYITDLIKKVETA